MTLLPCRIPCCLHGKGVRRSVGWWLARDGASSSIAVDPSKGFFIDWVPTVDGSEQRRLVISTKIRLHNSYAHVKLCWCHLASREQLHLPHSPVAQATAAAGADIAVVVVVVVYDNDDDGRPLKRCQEMACSAWWWRVWSSSSSSLVPRFFVLIGWFPVDALDARCLHESHIMLGILHVHTRQLVHLLTSIHSIRPEHLPHLAARWVYEQDL